MTQLEIAMELSYLTQQTFSEIEEKGNEVLRMINGLIESLRSKAKAASESAT